MQSLQPRLALLIGLFAATFWLLRIIQPAAQVDAEPRWPTDEAVFGVPGWQVGPASLEAANGDEYVTHTYEAADGLEVIFVITTSPAAKRVYRAGPEVPFLGSGFSISAPPTDLLTPVSGRGALLARRGEESWLELDSYGERRGLLGNGILPWALAIGDTLLGRPNDYYLTRVMVPLDPVDPSAVERAGRAQNLANVLFPRLAAWYGR
jgi:hypothetical protein